MDFASFVRQHFPALNAALNTLAAVLLVLGWLAIRSRKERLHRAAMLAAFLVSALFLACYLVYHAIVRHVPFAGGPPVSYVYYTILASHVVLAAAVPVLAIWAIWLGVTNQRARHRRVARWTLPIWLYVSVTGVVIYLMLYQFYPPPAG